MTVTMYSKQKGITLIETLLAVSVGVVIVGGSVLFFKSVQNSSKIASTIKIAGNISDAVRTYAQTSTYAPCTTTCLSTLDLTAGDKINPWDTSAPPAVFTNGNYMGIYFNSVPSGICTALAKQLSSSLPLPTATPSGAPVILNGVSYTITATNITGTWTCAPGPTCTTGAITGAAGCQSSTGTPLAIILDLS